MRTYDKFYIGGQWVAPSSDETIDSHNATTEEVSATIPAGAAADADAAVAAARGAFDAWAAKSPEERAVLMDKVADGLTARADEIAETISGEVGMPLKLSKIIQAGNPIAHFRSAAEIARSFAYEEELGNSKIVHEPIGVAACICHREAAPA